MGNEESIPAMAVDIEVEEEVQNLRKELKKLKKKIKKWQKNLEQSEKQREEIKNLKEEKGELTNKLETVKGTGQIWRSCYN